MVYGRWPNPMIPISLANTIICFYFHTVTLVRLPLTSMLFINIMEVLKLVWGMTIWLWFYYVNTIYGIWLKRSARLVGGFKVISWFCTAHNKITSQLVLFSRANVFNIYLTRRCGSVYLGIVVLGLCDVFYMYSRIVWAFLSATTLVVYQLWLRPHLRNPVWIAT